MKNQWRERLIAAVEADGRSDSALSTAAGLGRNFLQQMRQRGTSPTLDALTKLADVLGISVVYLVTGIKMDAEGERFIQIAADLKSDQRRHLLSLLQSISPGSSEEPR